MGKEKDGLKVKGKDASLELTWEPEGWKCQGYKNFCLAS